MFTDIYKSLKDGQFESAENSLNNLLLKSSDTQKAEKYFLLARVIEIQGKRHIDRAQEYVNQGTEICRTIDNPFLLIKGKITQSYILFKYGEYQTSFELLKDAEIDLLEISRSAGSLSNSTDDLDFWTAELYVLKGIIQGWSKSVFIHEFDQSKKYLQVARELCLKIGYNYQYVNCQNWFSLFNLYCYELEDAKGLILETLDLTSKFNIKIGTVSSQLLMGSYYWLKNDFSSATGWYSKGKELAKEIDNQWLSASADSFLGSINILQGDLETANSHLTTASKIFKELKDQHYLSFNNLELGEVRLRQGEIEEAIDLFNDCLVIFSKIQDLVCSRRTYIQLGKAYQLQNLDRLALKNYEKGILSNDSISNVPLTIYAWFYCDAIFNLVLLSIKLHEKSRLDLYLEMLKMINLNSNNKRVDFVTKLSNALVLKSSESNVDQTKSYEFFEELMKGEIVDTSMYTISLISYIEYLMGDLWKFQDKQVLDNIKISLERLDMLADGQNNIPLHIEVGILEVNFELLNNRKGKAIELLNILLATAREYNLINLERRLELKINEIRLGWGNIGAEPTNSTVERKQAEVQETISYLHRISKILRSTNFKEISDS